MSRAVTTYHHLEKQLQAICMIAPRFRRETSGEISTLQIAPPVLDWVRETLQSCVEARLQSSLSREEGTALAEMFPYFDHPAQYLSNV